MSEPTIAAACSLTQFQIIPSANGCAMAKGLRHSLKSLLFPKANAFLIFAVFEGATHRGGVRLPIARSSSVFDNILASLIKFAIQQGIVTLDSGPPKFIVRKFVQQIVGKS
jgi:hypothetical protein